MIDSPQPILGFRPFVESEEGEKSISSYYIIIYAKKNKILSALSRGHLLKKARPTYQISKRVGGERYAIKSRSHGRKGALDNGVYSFTPNSQFCLIATS